MSRFLSGPGRFLAWLTAYVAAYFGVFYDTLRCLPRLTHEPIRTVLLRQIYFTGIEALPLLALVAMVAGFAALSPLYAAVLQDMNTTVNVFRILILQEAAPVLVGFYILARSGSAIATELAHNRHHGEVASLYRMGMDAKEYLVAPRVVATALSVAALVVYFQVFMVLGGFALMSLSSGWHFTVALSRFANSIDPIVAMLVILKATIFGTLVGVISCQQGLTAPRGPLGIPVAARTAAVHSFTAIALTEGLAVFLFPR